MKPRASVIVAFALLLYVGFEALAFCGVLVLEHHFYSPYAPNISQLSAEQRDSLQRFLAEGRGQHVDQDPVLGWVPRAEANTAGMRDDREYARVPPPGMVRIEAFGDSFTYSEDVALADSWTKRLAAIDPSLEVLNYGVGAYGLDQAYLRYRRVGADHAPHIVFIGYMSENIARHVNVFRPFYSSAYRDVIFTKPRFVLRGDDLVLLDNPIASREDHERLLHDDAAVLRALGENDYHYRIGYDAQPMDVLPSVRLVKMLLHRLRESHGPDAIFHDQVYNPRSEAYRITLKLLDSFYREAVANGQLPVIVVFPALQEQQRSRRELPRGYAPLVDALHARGLRVIDVMSALEPLQAGHEIDDLVEKWGHFSPLANDTAARYVDERLRAWALTSPAGVRAAVDAERARLQP